MHTCTCSSSQQPSTAGQTRDLGRGGSTTAATTSATTQPPEGPSTSAGTGSGRDVGTATAQPSGGLLGLGLGAQRTGEGGGGKEKGKTSWPDIGTLQWLIVKHNPDSPTPEAKFSTVAALHSEILLVSTDRRQLYSWPCDESAVSPVYHPLTKELGLSGEQVALLASSDVRATVVTESGKVATFYDALLRGVFVLCHAISTLAGALYRCIWCVYYMYTCTDVHVYSYRAASILVVG